MATGAERGVLPANPEVERSLLGSLLLKNALLKEAAEVVRPDDFSLDAHRKIFRAMSDLGRTDGCFDEVTVAIRLGSELSIVGGAAYLSYLTSGAIERSTVKPLCEVIHEKAMQRAIALQAEALQLAALTPGIGLEECKKRASSILTCSMVSNHIDFERVQWVSFSKSRFFSSTRNGAESDSSNSRASDALFQAWCGQDLPRPWSSTGHCAGR